MDNKNMVRSANQLFHPSMYQVTDETPGDQRTLLTVRKQREKKLPETDIKKLVSPGSFPLTDSSAGSNVSGSNTRYLFKNLYGETLLTFLFFSEQNIQNIQNIIRMLVYKEMNQVIDNQSTNELLVIMRSIFLEYSAHPPLIDAGTPEDQKQKLFGMYTREVSRLNEIVINEIVPKIVSQLQQYLDYLRDASTQPYQMETPQNVSIAGERQYRSVTQVLTGGEL
uniref:Minor capsid protein P8 central region domain-containing protein n=1 Tax=viral metagenome TaxID=1070528 RepID=A0A6C0H7H1_9ZZZZ